MELETVNIYGYFLLDLLLPLTGVGALLGGVFRKRINVI